LLGKSLAGVLGLDTPIGRQSHTERAYIACHQDLPPRLLCCTLRELYTATVDLGELAR
jgi:hypothetical protein